MKHNVFNNAVEMAANAVRTSTLTATGVDLSDYSGAMHFVLMSSAATAGTTPTLNVKLQHSDSLSTGYEDVSGATFTEVTDAADLTEMLTLDVDSMKQFVRVVGTIGGTSTPTFAFGVVAVGRTQ